MCLMCEHYIATCEEQECVDSADRDDLYQMRSGRVLRLWRGYGIPCKHISQEDINMYGEADSNDL